MPEGTTQEVRQFAPTPSSEAAALKEIDFLMKRLDHNIDYTQSATRMIYLVNGAILAAAYFGFGQIQPLYNAFFAACALSLLLAAINYLHANFFQSHYAWYKVIEEDIRARLASSAGAAGVDSEQITKDLHARHDRYFRSDKLVHRILPFKRTHSTYLWIHLIIAMFLLAAALAFLCLGWEQWHLESMRNK